MKAGSIALIALCISFHISAADTVVFVTGEWAPYTSHDLDNGGYITKLINEICREADIKADISFFPWARAEAMIETGEAFCAFPYAVTEERKNKYLITDPLYSAVNAVFFKRTSLHASQIQNARTIHDLAGLVTATVIGSVQIILFKKHAITYYQTPALSQTILMLDADRIDFVITDSTIMNYNINLIQDIDQSLFENRILLEESKRTVAGLVSKKYPDSEVLLKRFNDAYSKIRTSGYYDSYIKQYHIQNPYK